MYRYVHTNVNICSQYAEYDPGRACHLYIYIYILLHTPPDASITHNKSEYSAYRSTKT